MPKVSVIVPIYQAESYIERCCHSLFSQTLCDMEFIFVNDGSKDKSIELIKKVLEEYPNRITQTLIIDRKDNHGVAYTRQEGLDNATGEYVIHCDSDDWVETSMYESLYQQALNNNADVVCCGYLVEFENIIIKEVTYPNTNYFKHVNFNISPLTGSLWNKLIRRELIVKNKIQFSEKIGWGEDFGFILPCLLVSKKSLCLKESYYHYYQNDSSITHTLSDNKVQQLICVASYIENFLNDHHLQKQYQYELNYLKFQVKAPLLMFPEVRNLHQWKKIFPECHSSIWQYPSSFYLKLASYLIICKLTFIAQLELTFRDCCIHLIKKR